MKIGLQQNIDRIITAECKNYKNRKEVKGTKVRKKLKIQKQERRERHKVGMRMEE